MKRKYCIGERYTLSKHKLSQFKIRYISLLAVLTSMCLYAQAQRPDYSGPADGRLQKISGRVRSAESGIYLQGAFVRIKGGQLTTETDSKGNFALTTSVSSGMLIVSYFGYIQQEIPFSIETEWPLSITVQLDMTRVTPLTVGDTVPESLWNLPLHILHNGVMESPFQLKSLKNKKLVVLDFWAGWCAPCVESVDEWHKVALRGLDGLEIVTVHMDYDYKAKPFIARRGWNLPTIYGAGYDILNRHFFDRYQVGGIVWIMDGKVEAIYYGKPENLGLIDQLLRGEDVEVVSTAQNTYTKEERGVK
ncbi:carboxypeptidase-like regulatory domain-containing protein [Parapedobacter sp. 10938]|uniref:carboxypeptidase-like regulatory domain-containing protein n=1 Tax=Parapedobacter flavus TaxID=3110225 RepID=UPI002DBBB949|nr:carboxypeptidase-like regulatory domain-containing protein [Parapedobacter sp. 10938]MEC3881915.1 carboxypeptidase-like regulatory domain-containing protein [Parapedobacter sp. 10938]